MPLVGAPFLAKWTSAICSWFWRHSCRVASYATDALTKAGVNVFAYGNLITVLINFLLLALGVFIIVKFTNKVVAEKEEALQNPAKTWFCCVKSRQPEKISRDASLAICLKKPLDPTSGFY